jgi:hypothetical protein
MALSVFDQQVYRSTRSGATPEQIASLWGTDVESVHAALDRLERARTEDPAGFASELGDD